MNSAQCKAIRKAAEDNSPYHQRSKMLLDLQYPELAEQASDDTDLGVPTTFGARRWSLSPTGEMTRIHRWENEE